MTTYAGFPLRRDRRPDGLGSAPLGCSATFRNTRSKSEPGVSAPTSRDMSMKRFDCAGSSGGGFGLWGMPSILPVKVWRALVGRTRESRPEGASDDIARGVMKLFWCRLQSFERDETQLCCGHAGRKAYQRSLSNAFSLRQPIDDALEISKTGFRPFSISRFASRQQIRAIKVSALRDGWRESAERPQQKT
jgi:hypothetical protein